jgi:hypothetical protein
MRERHKDRIELLGGTLDKLVILAAERSRCEKTTGAVAGVLEAAKRRGEV